MDQKAIFKAISDRFYELQTNVFVNMLLLLGILILVLVFLVLYRRRLRDQSVKEWQAEYARLIREWDLTINELDLLNRMAAYLDDSARKILLITNRNTYNHILMLLEKKEGGIPDYAENLTEKLYGMGSVDLPDGFETLFGLGRPVRLITSTGRIYSGHIISRENEKILLGNVHTLKNTLNGQNVRGKGRLFIQDYRGMVSHEVSEIIELSESSLQLNLQNPENSRKNVFRLPDIFIFLPGEKKPLETHFYRVSEGMGIVENPGGVLKMDQTVKVALQKDTNHHYHVNALVRGFSLNKRYAKLKFGYLDKKFY